jgi:hypothetical protein
MLRLSQPALSTSVYPRGSPAQGGCLRCWPAGSLGSCKGGVDRRRGHFRIERTYWRLKKNMLWEWGSSAPFSWQRRFKQAPCCLMIIMRANWPRRKASKCAAPLVSLRPSIYVATYLIFAPRFNSSCAIVISTSSSWIFGYEHWGCRTSRPASGWLLNP